MFQNYLKIALRNLIKQRIYSLINIIGLAIGMTCCLLIALYVRHELSYDRFHEKGERIYRVAVKTTIPSGTFYDAETPFPLAAQLQIDYSEVERVVRIFFREEELVTVGEKQFVEPKIAFADTGFFQMFSFPLLRGNPRRLLNDPAAVVLSASQARKYFGEEDPLGKTLALNNRLTFQVSAVMEDMPPNSHFHADILFSFLALSHDYLGFSIDQWGLYTSLYTYIMLPEAHSAAAFEDKLEPFMEKYSFTRPDRKRTALLMPLQDIHLHSHMEGEIEPNTRVSDLWIIATIGLFILLIASINFMNLTTARSARRAREVGVRKVLGAFRWQLIKQFIGESVILSLLAMLLAIALVELALPGFSQLVGKSIDFSVVGSGVLLGALLGLALLVGILSGIYPALFLTAYRPVAVLKMNSFAAAGGRAGGRSAGLRRGLVVTQFALAILLISGTIITRDQLHFLRNVDLGFRKDAIIDIPVSEDEIRDKYKTIKHELANHPNVVSVSACFKSPLSENGFSTSAYPNGRDSGGGFGIDLNFVDFDYLEQFDLQLLAGRNFSPNLPSDEKAAFIINESTMKRLGYDNPQAALGRKLPTGINRIEGTIIGVVKDYHNVSLHEQIQPLVMMYWPEFFYNFAVRVRPGGLPETIAHLEAVWKSFSPAYPFSYSFLDEDLSRIYAFEARITRIIGTFSFIAIFIACLGLFGLAAYTAEQRTKEIGVRKVLGAKVSDIVLLLSKEFVKLVLLAGVIAAPLAYWLMGRWLEVFAYRIEPGPAVFLIAGALALLIALLTISYQAIRAALAHPVESLRYE